MASYTCPAGQTLSGTTCTGTTRTAATPASNFSSFTIQTQRVLYYHHDHLGSVIALSDNKGAVVERMAFDAWGKRRNINGIADTLDQIQGVYQDRGYTMHENILMFP